MKTTLAVLALLSVVTAQVPDVTALPACVQQCTISALGGSGCDVSDTDCICKTSNFLQASTECINAPGTCTPEEIEAATAFATEFCGAEAVQGVTGGAGANSTETSTSSGSDAESTPSATTSGAESSATESAADASESASAAVDSATSSAGEAASSATESPPVATENAAVGMVGSVEVAKLLGLVGMVGAAAL